MFESDDPRPHPARTTSCCSPTRLTRCTVRAKPIIAIYGEQLFDWGDAQPARRRSATIGDTASVTKSTGFPAAGFNYKSLAETAFIGDGGIFYEAPSNRACGQSG